MEEFKEYLLKLLTEAREFSKRCNTSTSRAYINAKIEILELMAVFIAQSIQKGTIDMEKARSDIKVLDEGVVNELGRAKRESVINSKLIELANELKPGRFKQIDHKLIEGSHFATRVYNLRAAGDIPDDVKPKTNVNGETGLFLVKLTKEQMSAEPKRNRTKVSAN